MTLQAASPVASRRPKLLAWSWAALVAALVIVMDWVTKRAVEKSILPGEERKLLPGVQLVYTHNHGVAFGLLPGAGVYVTVALAAIVVAVLLYFVRRAGRPLLWLPAGLLIGGAIGNVLDRLRDGSVTDFIKLPLGWPPFNVADMAITIGVILLALLVGRAAEQRS